MLGCTVQTNFILLPIWPSLVFHVHSHFWPLTLLFPFLLLHYKYPKQHSLSVHTLQKMDSNSGFIWNPSPYHHQNNEDQDGFIDLGLSLKTLEPCEEDEGEGAQSKERWAYVKVNMDGVMVGRKICLMPHHGGYSSLAHDLEDMFGTQSESCLRLFQAGSQFSLFYMDRDKNWRTVGDVSWEEFVGSVKRLRITRNNC